MKCYNCGINYQDDERQCPMCGAKISNQGNAARTRSKNHRTKPSTTDQSRKGYPLTPSDTRLKGTGTGKATFGRDKTAKKKGKGIGIATVIIAVVVNFMPVFVEWAGQYGEDILNRIEYASTEIRDEDENVDLEKEDAMQVPASLIQGRWWIDHADGGTLELIVDGSDGYILQVQSPDGWTMYETGTAFLREEYQSYGVYNEMYPPEEYKCYSLVLSADDIQMDYAGCKGLRIPEKIPQHQDEQYFVLLLYRAMESQEDSLILSDYWEDYTPLLPAGPLQMQRKARA